MSALHTRGVDRTEWILSALISGVASSASEGGVMRRAVEVLSRLEGCREALGYRWDAGLETLVLEAAAPLGRRLAGEDTYGLGEGPIGRAALSTASAVVGPIAIKGIPRGSARLATVGARGTVAAVRIASPDDALLGVIAVVFDERGAATASMLRTIGDAASLVALGLGGGLERALSRRRADLLEVIEVLARCVSAEISLAEALAAFASQGLRLVHASACAIYVAERSLSDLRLAVVAPRDAAVPRTWRMAPGWERHHRKDPDAPRYLLAQPAVAGTERLGAIVLFDEGTRRATPEDVALCDRLARVAAVAIRQRRLLDGAVERTRAEDLLWEIVGPGSADPAAVLARAQRLGCGLAEPRVVVAATSPCGESAERLRGAILAADPSAIADVGGDHVVAIVSPDALGRIAFGSWSVGVSQKCGELERYPAAYRQARDTLDLGIRLFGAGRVARFEDLGSYRFVPALVQGGLTSESEYQQVSTLSDDLLRTLEAYLDNGGNTALAAKQLYLHRNTLRQRLERISVSLDIDLSVPSRWLALQLAIKTARMSRLAPSTRAVTAPAP